MSAWETVAPEGGDAWLGELACPQDHADGGWVSNSNSRQDCSGGWNSPARKDGRDDDGWNNGGGRNSRVRGRERRGRHSRLGGRYSAQEISRGRGGRARGRTCLMSGRVSPARKNWSQIYLAQCEGFGSPAREIREWGGSAVKTQEGWGNSASWAVEIPGGLGGSGSSARENSDWGGSSLKSGWERGWGPSGSPAGEDEGRRSESVEGEDGEESEASRSQCTKSENDDVAKHVSPEHEDDNRAGRNRRELIQSLQASLKSSFDEAQADLVRAEGNNKELTEANKRLKGELKRAKEGEVFSKQSLEETRNKLLKLVERTKILEEKQAELLKSAKEQEESSKKLEDELKRAVKREECSKQDLEQTKKKLRELCTTFAAVKEECDKVCDQQGAAPQVANKRKYVLKVLEVNDLLNCSICLEPWAQSGEHIVCSLSCGHFFGKSCITKWILKDERRGSSTCPACLRRVSLSDIRHHYVSQIYEA